jgi:heavy metal sensor kinase
LNRRSIQFRLAVWYLLSVAVIIMLFAAGSWFALRASVYYAIDRDLRYRMSAVVPFIESHSLSSREQFEQVFANSSDSSITGVFVQITDSHANLIYQSDILLFHRVPVLPPGPVDGAIGIITCDRHGWPVRVASRRVVVKDTVLTVHVIEPLRDIFNSLREYALSFCLLVPVALLLTTTVGYSMSRRALAPVEQIRRQAEAIQPSDLTTRLNVPGGDDELAKLAQTLNAMLARIEKGFRSVEQFTADASHELRAPLALIITAGDVSLRRERSHEEMVDTLQKIVQEARRMSKLVEDLLALARGDADRTATEFTVVDISGILRELRTELEPVAQSKGLRLTSTCPDHEILVAGAASDVRRLFLILIDNAIKYTESGAIALGLSEEGSHVKITVADSGIGIEPAALPHVFDRFWRSDKVRSRAEGGAGLGLALAAQIGHRNGGSISVQSNVGQGSTFTVRLQAAGI